MRACLALLLCLLSLAVHAHELQTVVVRMTESAGGRVAVTLNTPLSRDGQPSAVVPIFDARCTSEDSVRVTREPARVLRQWRLRCSEGLSGSQLRLRGLDPRTPEALVVADFADGSTRTLTLDRHDPIALISAVSASNAVPLAAYFPIGIEHILLGPDHLLFVLGLTIVVFSRQRGLGALAGALTAFTVAHSLTLALSVLGVWGLPPKPVEILIALSLLMLALEIARIRSEPGSAPTLSARYPWLTAFIFGLLHGFGFAGALSEIGLPDAARAWALLLFNLGVEAGQLMFVAALLILRAAWRRMGSSPAIPAGMTATLLGGVAAYWMLDRTTLWLWTTTL